MQIYLHIFILQRSVRIVYVLCQKICPTHTFECGLAMAGWQAGSEWMNMKQNDNKRGHRIRTIRTDGVCASVSQCEHKVGRLL